MAIEYGWNGTNWVPLASAPTDTVDPWGEHLVTWDGTLWHYRGDEVFDRPDANYAEGARVVWDTSQDETFTAAPPLMVPGDLWIPHESLSESGTGGLDQATADTRYVNVAGDTMTGPLTITDARLTVDDSGKSGGPAISLEAITTPTSGMVQASAQDATNGKYAYLTVISDHGSNGTYAALESTDVVFLSGPTEISLISDAPIIVGKTTYGFDGRNPQRITNLEDPVDVRDAVNKQYLDDVLAGAGSWVRTTAIKTTALLAAGVTESGTVAIANGYRLYRITTNSPCRVRLYTTAAKQLADASRPIGTDPSGDHGVMLEFVSTVSLLTADLSPVVDGFDGKTTPDGLIPYRITNTGTGAAAITCSFDYVRTE